MSNRNRPNRTNPFRSSQNRANFPPLDEFFDEQQSSSLDAVNISAISLDHSFHSRIGPCRELNFSVDMSIGGRAEMAQHRYQVQKYGIDCSHNSDSQDDDRSSGLRNGQRQRLNSTGDDWDRLMDDSASNVSFSSTAIVSAKSKSKAATMGSHTPSPDQSGDDDSGSSFFNKSAVQSLITPEKIIHKLDDPNGREWGVTLSRGIQENEESSVSADSPNQSINGSYPDSDFEKMFNAALRFSEEMGADFNEQSFAQHFEQVSADDRWISKADSKDRRGFASFAVDTSFATNSSGHSSSYSNNGQDANSGKQSVNQFSNGAKRIEKRNTVVSSGTKKLNRSGLPPTPTKFEETDTTSGVNLSIHGGRISPDSSRDVEKSGVFSIASSSAYPSPQMSPLVNETTSFPSVGYQAKADLFGLSPICDATQNVLKMPKSEPFEETSVTGSPCDEYYGGVGKKNLPRSVPFDEILPLYHEDVDSQPHFMTVQSTSRILFEEEDDAFSPLGLGTVKSTSTRQIQKKPSDLCCTLTTEEESFYVENALSRSLSAEACLFSPERKLGSNAVFRINSYVSACAMPSEPEGHSPAQEVIDRACGEGSCEPAITRMESRDPNWPLTPQTLGSWTCMDFNADLVQSLCHTTDSLKSVGVTTMSSDSNTIVGFHGSGNRRGVRLSRLTKLKELGLEHKLKLQARGEYGYEDSSF
ncbi:hypothetical protein ACHAXA_003690 [Cyclostephanos tholiformis]|uniref:Uncharacterized protein n=1 Tax=Cyclostephanos tholiformis TaxID=382380 RepID=A0ABD3RZ87_9STRA